MMSVTRYFMEGEGYMNFVNENRLRILLVCEILLIFLVHIFNIDNLYAFFLSEDELGYWGNAAFFLGRDWGNTVSYCPYYSYGYSLFLMLIMCLPVSGLAMYRCAIVANALFMVASFLISYYLFVRLLPERSKAFVSIACTVMALYASYVSQSSVAWSECYLVLFTWLIFLQGYFICRKTTTIRILVFAIELVYIYMIHQRTIPFLIAGICLIILLVARKKISLKYLFYMLVTVVGMMCLSYILKSGLKDAIYGAKGEVNDYSSIVGGMSLSNFLIPVIREIAGQFFYLWAGSFGIIPFGMGMVFVQCIKKWKKKDETGYFYGFILLLFSGILMVSAIFMRKAGSRVDYLIYGRYIEIAVGFFIIIGFLYLPDFVQWSKSWIVFAVSSLIFLCLAWLLINKIYSWNISLDTSYQGVCAAAVYWFYSLRGFRVMELCFVIMVLETLIFAVTKIRVVRKWIFFVDMVLIGIFWVKAGEVVVKQQICPYQASYNQEVPLKHDLWKYIREHDNYVVFLTNTQYNTRGSFQLYLQDIPLICVQDMKELNELPEVLIIDNDESTIDKNIVGDYHFVCMVGKKSIYSLDKIHLNDLQGEISKNQFAYNEIGTEESGYAMYGPYIRLEKGAYEVVFQMNSSEDAQGDLGRLEVASDSGNNIIGAVNWDGVSQFVKIPFGLEDTTCEIEFRYFKFEGNDTIPVRVILNEREE